MYYSSDNYVCICVEGLSTYGGFALNWINTSLMGIGCLGLFSFFKDLIPFSLDDQPNAYFGQFSIYYKLFSSISPFLVFWVLLRIMRKNKNK